MLMKNTKNTKTPSGYVKVQIFEHFMARKSHQKLKKCFGMERDIGKVNCSQLPVGLTVSMIFTSKSVKDIESSSLL